MTQSLCSSLGFCPVFQALKDIVVSNKCCFFVLYYVNYLCYFFLDSRSYELKGSSPCAIQNGGCQELCLLSSSENQNHTCVSANMTVNPGLGSGDAQCSCEYK